MKKNTKKQTKIDNIFSTLALITMLIGFIGLCWSFLELNESVNELSKETRSLRNYVYYSNNENEVNLTDRWGYFNGRWIVVETASLSLERYTSTAAHEIGHVFMYDEMSPNKKQEWIEIHNQSKNNHEKMVSDYASKNYKEDFAEIFERTINYCYNSNDIKHLSNKKKAFFDKEVKPYFDECGPFESPKQNIIEKI